MKAHIILTGFCLLLVFSGAVLLDLSDLETLPITMISSGAVIALFWNAGLAIANAYKS